MRIGLDARPALLGRSGFATVARELLAALRRRGDLQALGYGACWRAPLPGAPSAGIVRRRFPARLQAALAPLGFGVETLLGPLDAYVHTDLVFAPVRRAPQVLVVHDLLFLHGRDWHAPDFAARVGPRLFRQARAARALVAPSAAVADELVARELAPRERVHVIAWGADHVEAGERPDDAARVAELRRRAGLPDGVPLVLAPGTREPRKNHARLLQACLALPAGSAVLLVVGARGWGCEALEARLCEPALAGRAGVLGDLEDADLHALLRCADLVAYPSLAEGFGLPVLEAMRAGRAVLTSSGTPMAEHGGDAVLAVDATEVAALRDALARLLDDAPLRARLGRAAAARAARFTWDAAAARLADVCAALGSGNVDSPR